MSAIRECFEECGILLARKKGEKRPGELLILSEEERGRGRQAIHGNEIEFQTWVARHGGSPDLGISHAALNRRLLWKGVLTAVHLFLREPRSFHSLAHTRHSTQALQHPDVSLLPANRSIILHFPIWLAILPLPR